MTEGFAGSLPFLTIPPVSRVYELPLSQPSVLSAMFSNTSQDPQFIYRDDVPVKKNPDAILRDTDVARREFSGGTFCAATRVRQHGNDNKNGF